MKKFLMIAPLSLAMIAPAMAQSTGGDTQPKNDDASLLSNQGIGIEFQGRAAYTSANSTGFDKGNVDLSKTYLRLTGEFNKDIRAVVTLELNKALRANGDDTISSFDIDEFLKEAFIEIRNIGGQPVAVVVGKHQIAFGEEITKMPVYEISPLYKKLFTERALGFTVRLNYPMFKINDRRVADGVEVSFYSSQEDVNLVSEGKLGTYDGVSGRIKGQISGGFRYNASFAHNGNNHLGEGQEENKGSIGLLFADSFDTSGNAEGLWTVWANGLVTDKTTNGDDVQFAITGGATYQVGPGEIVVEGTWLQDEEVQVGIGYKLALYRNNDGTIAATIAPEYRHTFGLNNNDDDDSIGVAVSFNMGTVEQPKRTAVFGPQKVEAPAAK